MKTAWDYTELARSYLKRPDYSDEAINRMLVIAELSPEGRICDVGAGVAHLTLKLAERGYEVIAVEPNDTMRELGMERTRGLKTVSWFEGTGEDTCQPGSAFNLVTFGSSFNVTDRLAALKESHRILKPNGWFACMWNYRDLLDPLQAAIERTIKMHIPNYEYGTRREDQTSVILSSGLFENVVRCEGRIVHSQRRTDCLEAWRSHATLKRQAGDKMGAIIQDIEKLLCEETSSLVVNVPYTTTIWAARVRP